VFGFESGQLLTTDGGHYMKDSSIITKAMLVVGLSVFFVLGATKAFAQHEGHQHHKMHEESNKEVSLVGEVLDLYCYMKHPARGQGLEHAKCAKTCIRKGLPIGFLVDGEVYLIIGKEHESAKDLVVDFAGTQSRLTGTLIEHDGVKAIEVAKIEKVVATSSE
jgi:hypothetical protein